MKQVGGNIYYAQTGPAQYGRNGTYNNPNLGDTKIEVRYLLIVIQKSDFFSVAKYNFNPLSSLHYIS